ncbi:hypothetical protein DV735_g2500, partial [Chaetothyriales sp. CBS 134920]
MPTAYAVRDGGDAKSKKQSMADLKLRRLQELNSRLKEDLDRPRVKVAEASISLINYCNQTRDYMVPSCKWNLRAAYYAQELLQTFSTSLGEVALVPATGGTFEITIFYAVGKASTGASAAETDGAVEVSDRVLWDRKVDGGFPDTKELKGRVRDVVEPSRSLGHTDRALAKDKAKDGNGEADKGAQHGAQRGTEAETGASGASGAGAITITETVTAVQAVAEATTVTVTLTAVPACNSVVTVYVGNSTALDSATATGSQPVPDGNALILTTASGALSPGLSSIPAAQAVQTGVTVAAAAVSANVSVSSASALPGSFFTQDSGSISSSTSASQPVPNGQAPVLTTASGALSPGLSSIPAASAFLTGVTAPAAAAFEFEFKFDGLIIIAIVAAGDDNSCSEQFGPNGQFDKQRGVQ